MHLIVIKTPARSTQQHISEWGEETLQHKTLHSLHGPFSVFIYGCFSCCVFFFSQFPFLILLYILADSRLTIRLAKVPYFMLPSLLYLHCICIPFSQCFLFTPKLINIPFLLNISPVLYFSSSNSRVLPRE